MKTTIALFFALILAACGGGGDNTPGRVDIGPVDCVNHPELCQ